ncbi:MAG: oligosaccharide flippase family protein [Desulfobacteraceae bacterium]|nr:polysaccharide biosynthesis C-terminal domain-containing protein [Desulfobacteraceae bacterium]MBC2757890.1 oligosaccharide flippase family protein [Desulfobacteraceae bacterium]
MINWVKNEFQQGKTLISYGALKVSGLGFSFLIPIFLAAFLTPEVLGIYSLGMMLVYFFNSVTVHSSASPTVICGIEELAESKKISRTITSRAIILLISSAIFISAVLLLKNQIISFTKLTNAQAYLLILVFTGKTIESFIRCILIALSKQIQESIFQFTTSIISLTYIILIHFFWGITLERVFPIFLIAPLISVCFLISKADYQKFLPLAYDKESLKKLFYYTRWMALGGTAVYLLNWGDNIILRKFSTMEDIGVYNLGYQFFKGMIMIFSTIKIYFLPFVSQHIDNKSKIENYLVVKRRKLFLTGVIFSGCFFLVMPLFVELIYKGQYQDSVLVFRILLAGAICSLFSMFYDPIFSSLKKFHVIQSITVFCVIVNLTLDYIFVSHIGFIGAAIATSFSYFLMTVIKIFYFRKYCKPLII